MLNGILRGNHEERVWQRECLAVHGNLRFVHRFEQRGLRSRRRAIDFVGEHHIGENGAGAKLELARFRIVNADAEDVAGQQIGSELDALERAMKRFRQRLRERSLAHTGNIFDEQMAAGQQGDQRELDRFFLAENGASNGALELRNHLRSGGRHC
jgi:hypothetical protein